MAAFEDQAIYPGAELFLIKQFMKGEGVTPRQWLLGTGLSENQIDEPGTLVSLSQFDIIYRNIFRTAQRPDLGLALGKALNLSRWGMLSIALICSRTLGEALETANQFRTLLRSRFTLTPTVRGELVEIYVQKQEGMSFPLSAAFAHETLLGTLHTQIQELLGSPFHFSWVQLAYPAPAHADFYQKHLGCPVQFGCSRSVIAIPLAVMVRALPLGNPVTERQAKAICEQEVQRVAQVQRGDLSWLVRAEIAKSQERMPGLEEVAGRLHVTPRTLRRKLMDAGTSFRQITQEHQLQRALDLLADPQCKISTVADRCGFRDVASFREAFRRWTEMTPQQYRQQGQLRQASS